ncbi:MAG: hypothetical protein POELPBGB_02886 [Bacteroidia bacterium]|nr:hypothetical protein [Bacteroidia bacterium]
MKQRILCAVLFLLITATNTVLAQDPTFSQYYSNKLYYNPAFAGADPGLRVNFNYRNLWSSLNSNFGTYNVNIDIADFNLGGGIGAVVVGNVEGDGLLRTNSYNLNYSYRITVMPRMCDVHIGLQAGYLQKSIDWSRFVFSDQLDPVYGQVYTSSAALPSNNKKGMFDAAAGIMTRFNIKKSRSRRIISTNIGFSVQHITQPNESLIGGVQRLPRKYIGHLSFMIPVSKKKSRSKNLTYLSPNFIYERQSVLQTFNLGLFALRAPLVIGVWYRNGTPILIPRRTDALIFSLGFRQKDPNNGTFIYQFAYSYDLTLSKLAGSSGGSHEISLILEFTSARLTNIRSNSARRKARNCYNFNGPRNLPKIF